MSGEYMSLSCIYCDKVCKSRAGLTHHTNCCEGYHSHMRQQARKEAFAAGAASVKPVVVNNHNNVYIAQQNNTVKITNNVIIVAPNDFDGFRAALFETISSQLPRYLAGGVNGYSEFKKQLALSIKRAKPEYLPIAKAFSHPSAMKTPDGCDLNESVRALENDAVRLAESLTSDDTPQGALIRQEMRVQPLIEIID